MQGTQPASPDTKAPTPPVVAIGASAGGLEAIKEFLEATPEDTGACFVFVQHLDPVHKSMLPELLRRCTSMNVLQASDNLSPQPNTVVLIPPNTTLTYTRGLLHIERPAPPRQHRTPIDTFFESVAKDLGEYAICVLLSGTGSDGTHGLSLVKEAGGLTMVQDPTTAKYDSMPRNALATGFVDHELAPAAMPAVLLEHLRKMEHLPWSGAVRGELRQELVSNLSKICSVLRTRTGHEFRDYKEGTIIRRIHRRMQVLNIDDPEEYVGSLREDPTEVTKLLREILISVTSFFRDPPAFAVLAEAVIQPMVSAAKSGSALRIWVPGCASGEEAYTIAMLIHDRAEAEEKRLKIQLFATDIDEQALETARRGHYADGVLAHVPDRYRTRYFRQEGTGYRVVDDIREICIFSTQSVIKDPPFSRIDLLSCRNLLIYLNSDLQDRLIPIFHYALHPGGVLFLGSSENVTKHTKLFQTIDAKWRIFRRKESSELTHAPFPIRALFGPTELRQQPTVAHSADRSRQPATVAFAERLILDRLGPAYAIVSQERDVLYTGGDIESYLMVPKGVATHDLLAMIKPEMRMDVRAILHRTVSNATEETRNNVLIKDDGKLKRVRIQCAPLQKDGEHYTYIIVFHNCGEYDSSESLHPESDEHSTVEALERELVATKEYLQTTTEELESSNEELKSANEELMSMNEELQSSNEELETSKEELQSVNEELETVNSELASKVDELSQSNSDLENLFESTDIATLFLDRSLRVRRFTPKAKDIFHLIEADVGRAITDIVPRIETPVIEDLVKEVLNSQQPIRTEVHLRGENRTFMMRILPYRTSVGVIDGIVATFVDISDLAHAEAAAKRRAVQQDFLAHVSGAILREENMLEIVSTAPERIAALLNADFCKILQRRADAGDFEMVARYGFKEPCGTVIPGGLNSQAGYTLHAREPIIVEDLRDERRFRGPNLLTEYGIRSGISTVIAGPDGNWGVLGVHASAVRSFSSEDINFIQAVANVISTGLQREASLNALHESEERLASALKAGNLGVHDYDPQTGTVKWDPATRDLWGVAPDTPITYEIFMSGVHPSDQKLVQTAVDEALKPGGTGRFDAMYRVINAKDKSLRWVRADGDVTFKNGVATRLVGTVADISDRRRMEQHVQLLMREVNHRAKNLLAVVQAIARQTAKNTEPSEFAAHLNQRLQALAASQDLIIGGEWRSVSLADLVQSQVSHLGELVHSRFEISGEDVRLGTSAAQGIGLALHELATNATKYGALANEFGVVDISWVRDGEGAFVINWTERDGPPVHPPDRRGFGTTVIERMAASAVSGDVQLDFDEKGLRWRLTAPVEKVLYNEEEDTLVTTMGSLAAIRQGHGNQDLDR